MLYLGKFFLIVIFLFTCSCITSEEKKPIPKWPIGPNISFGATPISKCRNYHCRNYSENSIYSDSLREWILEYNLPYSPTERRIVRIHPFKSKKKFVSKYEKCTFCGHSAQDHGWESWPIE